MCNDRCKSLRCIGAAVGGEGDAYPNEGVGRDRQSEETVALAGVEIELGKAVGSEEGHEERNKDEGVGYVSKTIVGVVKEGEEYISGSNT